MQAIKRKLSGRLLHQPLPSSQDENKPMRKLSGRIKLPPKEEKNLEPVLETVCNENGCIQVERIPALYEKDLLGMDYKSLAALLDKQARFNGVHIPNEWTDVVKNLDGFLKLKYSEEKINAMGDLSNLRLITRELKRFIQ